MGISLPEDFIDLMYQACINSDTKTLYYIALKDFIEICQDTVKSDDNTDSKKVRELIESIPEE
jgi:hypothetical protein